jgi:hypothetical protein
MVRQAKDGRRVLRIVNTSEVWDYLVLSYELIQRSMHTLPARSFEYWRVLQNSPGSAGFIDRSLQLLSSETNIWSWHGSTPKSQQPVAILVVTLSMEEADGRW